MNDLQNYLKQQTTLVNNELDRILPTIGTRPARLHEAMRHSVFAGGKRLRPALCIAACEACGGKVQDAMDAACALELLHTYTLIHDDLPAMDDDTLRRGRPTCHIAFDEATAILAGDALLTLSFEVLARHSNGGALALELARAAGSQGVIGGQAEDLAAEGKDPSTDWVEYIHQNKTAALIRAACVMGGICAGESFQPLENLATYGEALGLAFQITDDLLDESSTVEELGKDIGSDKARGKMTYPAVHGKAASLDRIEILTTTACAMAETLPNGSALKALAHQMASRTV